MVGRCHGVPYGTILSMNLERVTITKQLGHNTQPMCQKSKPGPPKYEAASLTTHPKYEVGLLSTPTKKYEAALLSLQSKYESALLLAPPKYEAALQITQPEHAAASLTIQSKCEAASLTIQPKYEAASLTIQPTHKAAFLTTEPQHFYRRFSKYVTFHALLVRLKGLNEATQNSREQNFNSKLHEQGAGQRFSNPEPRLQLGSRKHSDRSQIHQIFQPT